MKAYWILGFVTLVLAVVMIGCQKGTPSADDHGHGAHEHDDSTIEESLAKLSPADRKVAEEQGYCANEPESKLGSMGVPLKVSVNGRDVFVCCDSCTKHALENPEKTLAVVDGLRAKVQGQHKHP
ncbi:MAG: hypothetical protein J0M17_04685 [Planctomycetes bacterium]|nr:hypothetical protein [Planctomycetota bacterium]